MYGSPIAARNALGRRTIPDTAASFTLDNTERTIDLENVTPGVSLVGKRIIIQPTDAFAVVQRAVDATPIGLTTENAWRINAGEWVEVFVDPSEGNRWLHYLSGDPGPNSFRIAWDSGS